MTTKEVTEELEKLIADVTVGRFGTKNRSELISRLQGVYLDHKAEIKRIVGSVPKFGEVGKVYGTDEIVKEADRYIKKVNKWQTNILKDLNNKT